MTYHFHVPGVAKTERKRQRMFTSKSGRTVVGARTDEPDRQDFKARLAFFTRQAIPAPLCGPVVLELQVTRPCPKSMPKRATAKNPWPWADIKRPDADNYVKICCDAMTGIAWNDDAQIIDLRVTKAFGEHGVTVTITEAQEGEAA